MTKTIEFIEKEIEFLKKQIVKYENHLLGFPQVNVKNRLEEMKKDLKILQQIKCELEAWEEVKKDKGVCEKQEFRGKDCKKVIQISCKIFPEGTEQYETFKKALEVENE